LSYLSEYVVGTLTTCPRADAGAWINYPFLTSKERDVEIGLDYFLARYYSSTQGRFTSPDEFDGGAQQMVNFAGKASANPMFYSDLTQPQSLNKYQYCFNNPLRYVDPSGHEIFFVYIGGTVLNPYGHAAIKHIDENTGAVTYYDVAEDKNGGKNMRVNTYTPKEFSDRYGKRGIEEVHVDVPNEAESLKYIESNKSANWNYNPLTNNCVAFAAYVVEQGGGKVVSDGSRSEDPKRYPRDARDGYKKENERKKKEGDKNKYSAIDPEKIRIVPLELFE
jgi:RHS repeat-associated protein